MEKLIQVTQTSDIICLLKNHGIAKNKIKTYIKLGYIYVNNKKINKLPYTVNKNDFIKISTNIIESKNLDIVYEDNNYLVINKECGLLTISTSTKNKALEDTLYKRARKYLNKKGEFIFTVNRIDRDTSGLVIFVKNEKLKNLLQNNWNNIVKKRGYIAIVIGKINKSGKIDNHLYEDKQTFSHSTNKGGKRAITIYNPIKSNNKYTMLDINILTGRKNQIRVHLSEMNHPILGDKKYKSRNNPLKRLALHHYEITLICPLSNKILDFKVGIPNEFYTIFN